MVTRMYYGYYNFKFVNSPVVLIIIMGRSVVIMSQEVSKSSLMCIVLYL